MTAMDGGKFVIAGANNDTYVHVQTLLLRMTAMDGRNVAFAGAKSGPCARRIRTSMYKKGRRR
jgi:hypothetical protein